MITQPQIKRLLSHRYPMLLVDAIVSLNPWDRVVGVKCVTATDPCYAHLPDDAPEQAYAYPLSLTIEAFVQTCGILINSKRAHEGRLGEELMLAGGVTQFDSLRDVFPGERLEMRGVLAREQGNFAVFDGEVSSDDRLVAVVETLILAFRSPKTAPPLRTT